MTGPATSPVRRVQSWLDASPAIGFLGLICDRADAESGTVTLRMPLRPELERSPGTAQFHGGPVAALIDTAGDMCVALVVNGGVPTINMRVDYLRPSGGEFLLAHASLRRSGRTIAIADVEIRDASGRLTALGRGCYSATPG